MTTRPNTAAALAAMQATLEADMKARERDRIEAKEQREAMANDIAGIKHNAITIDRRVAAVESDVREMKPTWSAINTAKAKFAGGLIVLGAIGTVVLGFVTYFKEQLVKLIFG
jgi:nucleotide-binding universal stress UspA family protein